MNAREIILKLVSRDLMEEAIDTLLPSVSNQAIQNELSLLSSELVQSKNALYLALITKEQANQERSKARITFLNLLDNVDERQLQIKTSESENPDAIILS